jgi:hypothetical protein
MLDQSKFGQVSGYMTEKARLAKMRREAVRVQTIREFIAIDPEHEQQVAALINASTSAQVASSSEGAGSDAASAQQQTIAAASLSRNFTTESTSTRSINLLAAVAAGASVLAARYQRWRKRRLAEAAATRLASMLQFDPLAAWLDDERRR